MVDKNGSNIGWWLEMVQQKQWRMDWMDGWWLWFLSFYFLCFWLAICWKIGLGVQVISHQSQHFFVRILYFHEENKWCLVYGNFKHTQNKPAIFFSGWLRIGSLNQLLCSPLLTTIVTTINHHKPPLMVGMQGFGMLLASLLALLLLHFGGLSLEAERPCFQGGTFWWHRPEWSFSYRKWPLK